MPDTIECWACPQDNPADASGFTKKELQHEGWRWYTISKGQSFPMCDSCVRKFAPKWDEKKAAA